MFGRGDGSGCRPDEADPCGIARDLGFRRVLVTRHLVGVPTAVRHAIAPTTVLDDSWPASTRCISSISISGNVKAIRCDAILAIKNGLPARGNVSTLIAKGRQAGCRSRVAGHSRQPRSPLSGNAGAQRSSSSARSGRPPRPHSSLQPCQHDRRTGRWANDVLPNDGHQRKGVACVCGGTEPRPGRMEAKSACRNPGDPASRGLEHDSRPCRRRKQGQASRRATIFQSWVRKGPTGAV